MIHRLVQGAALVLLAGCAPAGAQLPAPAPELQPQTADFAVEPATLVVLLTVDQLRPDYFERYGDQLSGARRGHRAYLGENPRRYPRRSRWMG